MVKCCMITYRSEEDSPNEYESISSHSEEERPTQWPNVIVCRYAEDNVEQNNQLDGNSSPQQNGMLVSAFWLWVAIWANWSGRIRF